MTISPDQTGEKAPDEVPWLVDYNDIRSSFELAMQSEEIPWEVIVDVLRTVDDYAVNNCGDD